PATTQAQAVQGRAKPPAAPHAASARSARAGRARWGAARPPPVGGRYIGIPGQHVHIAAIDQPHLAGPALADTVDRRVVHDDLADALRLRMVQEPALRIDDIDVSAVTEILLADQALQAAVILQ